MQLSLFEDVTDRHKGVEFVVKRIINSDSIRDYIKQAIKENDRNKLIKLFQESINTFGFACPQGYTWSFNGVLTDKYNQEYKITAKELADTALKIYRR